MKSRRTHAAVMAILLGLSCFALAPTIYNAVATIAGKTGKNSNGIAGEQVAIVDAPVNRSAELSSSLLRENSRPDPDNRQLPGNSPYGSNFPGDPELLDYLLGKSELAGMSRPGYPDIESPFQDEFAGIAGLEEFAFSTGGKGSNPSDNGMNIPDFVVGDIDSNPVGELAPVLGTGIFALNSPGNPGSGTGNLHLNTASDAGVATAGFSPVPLPAAAWLFGSALFAVFGISRRKAAATV